MTKDCSPLVHIQKKIMLAAGHLQKPDLFLEYPKASSSYGVNGAERFAYGKMAQSATIDTRQSDAWLSSKPKKVWRCPAASEVFFRRFAIRRV